jgi:hypothetical protein
MYAFASINCLLLALRWLQMLQVYESLGVMLIITFRSETPEIAIFRQGRIEKRLVRNAWHSTIAHILYCLCQFYD